MYVFFSGEGATDLGVCKTPQRYCSGINFLPGPLAYIVADMISQKHNESIIDGEFTVFIDGAELEHVKITLRPSKKSIRLRSTGVQAETRFHFEDARSFAVLVSDFISTKDDKDFLAVLFRDSNTTDNKEWTNKRNSMVSGFDAGFAKNQLPDNGIPMLPKPVSEAWLLCAIERQGNPTKNCNELENRKRGNGADHALKIELEAKLGEQPTRELLIDWVQQGKIRRENIDLPSFNDFRQRLTNKL